MGAILLADDSPHAQRMGERILREEGYQVVCAADGATAALRALESDPDVVIADAHLPGLDGAELCRRVKARSPHARVILTAGSQEALDEAGARHAGCDDFLRKPFEATEVLAMVERHSREARSARRSPEPETVRDTAVREAVTRAVEAELPRFIEEVTRKVLRNLKS